LARSGRSTVPAAGRGRSALVALAQAVAGGVVVAAVVTAVILGWFGFELQVREDARWVLPVASGLATVALLLIFSEGGRQQMIQRTLDRELRLLRSVDRIAALSATTTSSEEVLYDLLDRLLEVVHADTATVFLVDEGGRHLVVRATRGFEHLTSDQSRIPIGRGVVGRVVSTGAPIVVQDTDKADMVLPVTRERLGSLIACPLIADGRTLGVLRVGSANKGAFGDDDLRLMQLAAERASAAISSAMRADAERRLQLGAEHARLHLRLLAEAGALLDDVLEDVGPAFDALGRLVVPLFADVFCIDLLENGQDLRTVVCTGRDLTGVAVEHRGSVRHVVETGAPLFVFEAAAPADDISDADRPFLDALTALELESVLVVPVRARGLMLGAMTFATRQGRRGYRPSDLAAGSDLASRVATTVERVALYRETREAAERSARYAARLRRLMEAAVDVGAAPTQRDVLDVVARHAMRVLDAAGASAKLTSRGNPIAALVGEEPGPGALTAPITATDGEPIGRVAVAGDWTDHTDEDQSLLVSLAQIGSVSLENSRLYDLARSSENRLRALVASAPFGIIELDPAGKVVQWNPMTERLLGWTTDVIGRPLTEVLSIEALDVAEAWSEASSDDSVSGLELTVHDAAGEEHHLSLLMVALRPTASSVTGMMAVLVDLTERRRLEEQVLRAGKMEAIGRLAGGLAHDFNNLLAAVIGYSELVIRRLSDDDPLIGDVQQISNAGRRAAQLTRQLLTLSRRDVMRMEVVDVADVVDGLAPMLQRVLGVNVDVVVERSDEPATVKADQGQLEQVLLNLAINAGDAMPDGGRLDIAVDHVDLARTSGPEAPALPGGRHVRLTVRDTGTGMPADVLAHCFEPFFTTKERDKGTGLGLSVVYGIVSQHRGRISVESEEGAGTTFVVDLPYVAAVPEERPVGLEPLPTDGVERVLLVEDDPAIRRLGREILGHAGYTVVDAADGLAAMALIEQQGVAFDVLVTDVVMPGMNGKELVAKVRAQRPDVKVLFVSGFTQGAFSDDEAASGRDGFLAKPFTADALLRAVRQTLEPEKDPELD
jgi:PAS domain S-box-containing protein